MQQLIELLAKQGIIDGVGLVAAGRARLMMLSSSLPADITDFVCSLAEAFHSCVCFVAPSSGVCIASGSRKLGDVAAMSCEN